MAALRLMFLLACSALLAAPLPAQTPAKTPPSPFAPPAKSGPAANDANVPFVFNGIVAAGERTMVCVTTIADQRSRWINIGAMADGIKVAQFDPAAQQIVVEHEGNTYTLELKRGAVRPGSPTSAPPPPATPLPVANVAAPAPVTDAEKEREARFLVSDLLEIGMIQRKAYEEAQRKAQAEGASEATPKPAPPKDPPRR